MKGYKGWRNFREFHTSRTLVNKGLQDEKKKSRSLSSPALFTAASHLRVVTEAWALLLLLAARALPPASSDGTGRLSLLEMRRVTR